MILYKRILYIEYTKKNTNDRIGLQTSLFSKSMYYYIKPIQLVLLSSIIEIKFNRNGVSLP